MDTTKAVGHLNSLVEEAEQLHPKSETQPDFVEWRNRSTSVLRHVLPANSDLLNKFQAVRFRLGSSGAQRIRVGIGEAQAILRAALFEIEEMSESAAITNSAGIDPGLWEHIRQNVEGEAWVQVASQSVIYCESKLREWAELPATVTGGSAVMTSVLNPDQGRFVLGRTPAEQQGWFMLGKGIAQAAGNVDRHRFQERDDLKRYSLGVMGAVSLLLTQLRFEHSNRFSGRP